MSHGSDSALGQRDFMSSERDLPPREKALVDDLGNLLSAKAKPSSVRADVARHSLDFLSMEVRVRERVSDFEPFILYFVTDCEMLTSGSQNPGVVLG
jgi:hypothetical protein